MGNPFKKFKEQDAEQKEDFRRRNPKNLPTKMSLMLRIIVGVYLYYCIYSMIKDGALQEPDRTKFFISIAAIVLFVGCGAYFIISSVKKMIKHEYFDPKTDDFSEEAQAGENTEVGEDGQPVEKEIVQKVETPADDGEVKTISKMAKLPDYLQVPEDEQ